MADGRGVAQSGSAPEWGSGGRWFESSRPDQQSPSGHPFGRTQYGRPAAAVLHGHQDSDQPVAAAARALVAEVERRLRERGARRVTALIAKTEEEARAFWEAVGYGHDVRMLRHVKMLD